MVNKDILQFHVDHYLSLSFEEINEIFENDEENSIVIHKLDGNNYLYTLELMPIQLLGDTKKELQVILRICDGDNELHCELYYPRNGVAYSDLN